MALIHCGFASEVLGLQCSMDVIVPQAPPKRRGAVAAGRVRYPVLYLLHGLSDDHTIWQRRTSIERYVEGRNLAVVMPAVGRSFYTDMVCGGRYGTFVSEELPAIARSLFPLSAARADNFVAGLSMGGYGAFRIALSRPDRFAAAASLSGAMDVARLAREPQRSGEMQWIFGDGRRVKSSGSDLFRLAGQVARRRGPAPKLYQWCGTEDFLYADNLRFRDAARKVGLPLTYEDSPGGHEWSQWDRQIQRVLAWLPLRKNG